MQLALFGVPLMMMIVILLFLQKQNLAVVDLLAAAPKTPQERRAHAFHRSARRQIIPLTCPLAVHVASASAAGAAPDRRARIATCCVGRQLPNMGVPDRLTRVRPRSTGGTGSHQ